MKEYKNPEFHFVRNIGGLSSAELVKLSDEELSRYLTSDGYLQRKMKYRSDPDTYLGKSPENMRLFRLTVTIFFSNAMMVPNRTAVFLWKEFEQASTIQDIVIHAMEKYDADEERKSGNLLINL